MLLEVIGFFLVFGMLATLIGTLVSQPTWRYVGFGVLVFFALVIGRPIIDGAFFSSASQTTSPESSTSQSPLNAPSSSSYGVGGPTEADNASSTGNTRLVPGGDIPGEQTYNRETSRGIRAMW